MCRTNLMISRRGSYEKEGLEQCQKLAASKSLSSSKLA